MDKKIKKMVFNEFMMNLFFKRPDLFDRDVLERLTKLYLKDVPELNYLLYFASKHETGPPLYSPGMFPHRGSFKKLMAAGKKRDTNTSTAIPVSKPDKKNIGGKAEVFHSGILLITPSSSPG